MLACLLALMSSALLSATGNPLPALLKELPQGLGELAGKAEHEVQILYTAIDRKNDGTPVFTTHSWQLDDRFYFYPASTVKFPAALAALEKKNALARTNPELDGNSVMLTDQSETWQTAVTEDPSATNGLPSLNHYIRKIFLVSDNDAFNRLFEFVGYEEMNGSLRSKGMTGCSIIHRLALKREKHHGRYANPIRFLRGNEVLCQLPARVGSSSEEHGQIVRRGVGYFSGGQLIPDPMDFSQSNFYPLTAQQECLKRLVFPAAYGPTERFELTPEDRQLVLDAMGRFPGESTSPVYPRERYPDSYTKMLGFGAGTDP
ncbi:MAG: serine hydrolase, partial [Verrucomicrobiota bacterium]